MSAAALRPPRLTAILIMPRGFDELTGTIAHLRAQTIRSDIQVVIVTISGHEAQLQRDAFEGFAGLVVVTVSSIPTVASAFVVAATRAEADVVALVEDHVFVEPEWAANVCRAFEGGCAAVAPRILNANPDTATSWMNFLVCFMDAAAFPDARDVESGPGHNTSYRRSVLERYGNELATLIQTERNFHYRLRADGHVLRSEPAARLRHMNISIPREAYRQGYLGGLMFAQYRSAHMSLVEKIGRTVLSPLVPPIRLWRMLRELRRLPDGMGAPLAAWLLVPAGLAAHAAGEAVGYWRIVSNVESKYEFFELHRIACVRPEERGLMTDGNVIGTVPLV